METHLEEAIKAKQNFCRFENRVNDIFSKIMTFLFSVYCFLTSITLAFKKK